ncbi:MULTISPECIES: hypothetical protein [Chromohalobacter]|uniref:Uncharacterized protein n=1 Tax=Chromohalobacter israelensis (strain ATCC BAA-138 / DSM 3043 / CIP 106854 / NCIMB 13768 / 1H11) TaxID=290398 RepID=Q1R0C5_CHRI1|nr:MULTISPECIES: hypothetical protein [Chromohalobacter]ABE57833.1 hypothetical protein Csal_0471 [Chromohalobacter salexigens DSM 3043]MBZ5877526.1 hypothetical protein [Chromohalobacter salexigens]MDF9435267.1 hypothetical protein [Chromohalobacter israelensis]MDO0947321.1 hypothetical protein [Chromohalobacter salexigens]NQY47379.1 hypothetical protein [Chromohalobacter sp.]
MVNSRHGVDGLRAVAIASQAVGFILIIALETWLGDAARVWQGVTLAAMLVAASGVALVRRYRRNRQRRAMDERLRRAEESDP